MNRDVCTITHIASTRGLATVGSPAVYIPLGFFAAMCVLLTCWCQSVGAFARIPVVGQSTDESTLTVTSTCGPAQVKIKKRGVLTTPFTVTFPRGKTIRLKALDTALPGCGALPVVSKFDRLIVNQTEIAEGQRAAGVFPTLRIDSYQLRRNGAPAPYLRVGEEFSDYTFSLSGDAFPPDVTVFADGERVEILNRASPTEIEIRLPARKAHAPGFSFVRVFSADSRFSNAVPIEVRKD